MASVSAKVSGVGGSRSDSTTLLLSEFVTTIGTTGRGACDSMLVTALVFVTAKF